MARTFIAIAALVTSACSGTPDRLVVRTVSDATGKAVAGVRVQIDGQPWGTTDAEGKATFDAVPGPFTVGLHAPGQIVMLRARTGREVVAEVTPPEPSQWHYAHAAGTVAGRSGAPSPSVVRVGFAPFRDWSTWAAAAADSSFDMFVGWRGHPSESSATLVLHAWESDAADPPGHYYGFGHSASLSLNEDRPTTGVPLSLVPVSQGTVDGTISVPADFTSPEVLERLWLAFGRYEELTLVSRLGAPGNFTRVVPSVEGAQPWIGVWAGPSWHRRRVAAPSSTLVFAPPVRPELLEPAGGTAIGSATFRWSTSTPSGSSVLYVRCNWTDSAIGKSALTYSVEAEGRDATLPVVPGVSVPAGAACEWWVRSCAAADPTLEERCAESAVRAATW